MKIIIRSYLVVLVIALVSCQKPISFDPEITRNELYAHIDFLASDSLQGRYPGTPFDRVAAKYLKDAMESSGLKLLGKNGYQFFEFIEHHELGQCNILRIGSLNMQLGSDFTVFPFSSSDTISSSVVFAGFGFRHKDDTISWDDYLSTNVSGKWVLILRGDPKHNDESSPFREKSGDRNKALVAKDQGAVGVLLVSGNEFDPGDELTSLNHKSFDIGIPVLQITRNTANKILKPCGRNIEMLEAEILSKQQSSPIAIATRVDCRTEIINRKNKTQNVIGLVEGTHPTLKDQYIVIGAHYDHIGLGGKNSSSRTPDSLAVHNGADDNASGVASFLEIAQKLSANKPHRSIVIIAFGAEEQGLLGSRFFVENPIVPLESIVAMVNIDMLGRLNDDRTLQISGVKTSVEVEEILAITNEKYSFNLSLIPQGYGPSDHASFYSKDIPVLFFSTGPHIDYHTPNDNIQRINFDGLKTSSEFIYDVVFEIANRQDVLTFQEAGPKMQSTRHGKDLKVRLGIMPDVSGARNDGLLVLAVNPDQPAYIAGIQKGDIIVAIGGKEVRNIQDYMFRLQDLKTGITISVEIKRNETLLIKLVQL